MSGLMRGMGHATPTLPEIIPLGPSFLNLHSNRLICLALIPKRQAAFDYFKLFSLTFVKIFNLNKSFVLIDMRSSIYCLIIGYQQLLITKKRAF
jgi:hypothetical protein